jgi:hypothetical protein
MIKQWIPIAILLAFNVMPACAQEKENERVASAGRVMSEILGPWPYGLPERRRVQRSLGRSFYDCPRRRELRTATRRAGN